MAGLEKVDLTRWIPPDVRTIQLTYRLVSKDAGAKMLLQAADRRRIKWIKLRAPGGTVDINLVEPQAVYVAAPEGCRLIVESVGYLR